MAGGLNANNSNYVNITYKKIINEIIKEQLEGTVKVEVDKFYINNISKMASKIAYNLKNEPIDKILGIPSEEQTYKIFSTLTFENELNENKSVKELSDCFKNIVDDLKISPADKDFYYTAQRKGRSHNLGLDFGFQDSKSVVCELDDNANTSNPVRQDKAEIYIDLTNMEEDIEKSLIEYYTKKFKNNEELEYIIERIKNRDELVNKIRDYIVTYRDGYLKRLVEGPLYLNFMKDILDKNPSITKACNDGYKLYSNYVKRANDFEKFIQDSILNDGDNMYLIEYKDKTLDFIHSVRTNSVYQSLPFSGKLEQSPLSDVKLENRSKGCEIYGLSLKRNGKVMSDSNSSSSFEYNLNLLITLVQEVKKNEAREKHNQAIYKLAKQNNQKVNEDELEELYEIKDGGFDFIKALMYKYMLLNLEDENYNAVEHLKNDLLKYKEQGLNTTEKAGLAIRELILDIYKTRKKIMSQLLLIKGILDKCLDNTSTPYTKEFTKKFSILNSILPTNEDLNNGILIDGLKDKDKGERNFKYNKLFKYTTLLDEELNKNYYAYSFDYKITLTSDVFCKATEAKEIKTAFNRDYFNPFGIVFYPAKDEVKDYDVNYISSAMNYFIDKELKLTNSSEYHSVLIEYSNDYKYNLKFNNKNEEEVYRFVYETAYTFIATALVSLIAKKLSYKIPAYADKLGKYDDEKLKKRKNSTDKFLYLMPLQLTFNNEDVKNINYTKGQTFIYGLRKSLASSLSRNYTSYSQGFNVPGDKNKTNNAINSLFLKVHKELTLPKPIESFDKIAVIVASSRQHNCSKYGTNEQEVTLHGEIIVVNVNVNNRRKISVIPYGEFCQFLDKKELHKNPTCLRDKVAELSSKGFKDIIYLAKSPFTANMVEKKTKTEMYFMNEEVIKTMIGELKDVTIYPLYINNCKIHGKDSYNSNSSHINIAPVKNMCKNLEDELEGIIPIFQLFSDNAVNNNGENFYNEMILYSTIKGIYSDKVKSNLGTDKLLENYSNNKYTNDLKYIMTALHIVRNEKHAYGRVEKAMKNNPFEMVLDIAKGTNGISICSYRKNGSRGSNKEFTLNRFALISYINSTIEHEAESV